MLDSTVFLEDSDGSGGGRGRWSAFNRVAVEFGNELGGGGAEEEGDRSSGSKRWPREETAALLKIRSDMDQAFHDASTFIAPLWDEVSRKLGELGYNRNAKKCKEKFENIYKYHKRTKAGRSSRLSGKRKNYRFYEQLESFHAGSSVPSTPSEQLHVSPMEKDATSTHAKILVKTVSSCQDFSMPCSTEFMSVSTSTASSSGKDSEMSVKKKRKVADYFQSLTREVLERQETFQKKFLEVIEKSGRDRAAREEAWKVQEAARMKREREFLAKEKVISAAKDAAILAFLQKLSRHMKLPVQVTENLDQMFEQPFEKQGIVLKEPPVDLLVNGTTETSTQMSSSRWPKAEVEALIMLKTDLDTKYEDNGTKGTLWEDISTCMKKLGYSRNAKRCKEKWENINKYYKRVKYGDKKRPGNSKTCPYFGMLDALYADKSKDGEYKSDSGDFNTRPEQILMQMIRGQQSSLGEYEQERPRQHYEEVEQGNGSGDVAMNCPSVPLE